RRGAERDAHTAEEARRAVRARGDTAPRLGDALQVRDHALAAAAVLEIDDERGVGAMVLLLRMSRVPLFGADGAEVADVALLLEQAGDLLLDPRVRHLHVVVQRPVRVS